MNIKELKEENNRLLNLHRDNSRILNLAWDKEPEILEKLGFDKMFDNINKALGCETKLGTNIKSLSHYETEKVKKILDDLEAEAYFPLKKISGGFADAEVYDYDEDNIWVELKFGVYGNVTHTENHIIDRTTLQLIT